MADDAARRIEPARDRDKAEGPSSPGVQRSTITAIKTQRRNSERVNVHVDGEFAFAVAKEVVAREGLRVGAALTPDTRAALEAADDRWKAKETALNLLSHRARSARELERRLTRKEYSPEVAAAVVADLERVALIDDRAFAEMFVRDRVRLRPKGRRVLVGELRAKGVDAEVAEAAVDAVLDAQSVDEIELARAAAARWRRKPGEGTLSAKRRLYAYLARRGFGGEDVGVVVDETLGEGPGER